jgi:hypothetical protein
MKRLTLIASVALISTVSFAHQDSILKVYADGRIDGLPAQYNPASLRVVFSRNNEPGWPPVSSLELKLGGKSVVVPECVTGPILTSSIKDVRVVASWYHDTSMLPPYLDVTFYDPGNQDAIARPGYKLLFNLSTGKLFQMEVMIARGADATQDVLVDFSARCPSSKLHEFSESRLRPNTSLERTPGR